MLLPHVPAAILSPYLEAAPDHPPPDEALRSAHQEQKPQTPTERRVDIATGKEIGAGDEERHA